MELPDKLAVQMNSGFCAAWQSSQAWAVLNLTFDTSDGFIQLWRTWIQDAQRPHMLHFVGICSDPQTLLNTPASSAEATALANALQAIDFTGKTTFHRIWLNEGRVCLTLCVGPMKQALSELGAPFDFVYACPLPTDPWLPKLIARRCHRGTRVTISDTMPLDLDAWTSQGFKTKTYEASAPDLMGKPGSTHTSVQSLTFNPAWQINQTRQSPAVHLKQPGRCAVVGAGLAGATVAHALAVRGWQVQVFEQASHAAAGASGLPVGLIAPHRSRNDDLQSQLSRSGVRLMLDLARRYLCEGQDWGCSGILELARDPALRSIPSSSHWHALGAWIKPAELVKALLQHPNIAFIGNGEVQQIKRNGQGWNVQTATNEIAWHADCVVVTNAFGLGRLLHSCKLQSELPQLAGLHRVFGTVSHGTYAQTGQQNLEQHQPSHPVNGNGSYIPNVPTPWGPQWFTGATFTTDPELATDIASQRQANFARLSALLPATALSLQQAFEQGGVNHWSGERCVTQDRLPLVGPVDPVNLPGLWCSVGMGSKGLSLSSLCAEVLVARLCGEPLPIELRLAKALDVARYARQRTRQVG